MLNRWSDFRQRQQEILRASNAPTPIASDGTAESYGQLEPDLPWMLSWSPRIGMDREFLPAVSLVGELVTLEPLSQEYDEGLLDAARDFDLRHWP